MGHVSNNIGGVYEIYKTYDQEGAVYTHVDKNKQKEALNFIQKQLFETPTWLIDTNIFNKIESAGNVERIRGFQTRTLDNILDFGRMARMIENETINGNNAYPFLTMMQDVRTGIWSELNSGKTTDVYRRNLQRAYIDRMAYLMTENQSELPAAFRRFISRTNVNVSQSDIRAVVRAELKSLESSIRSGLGRTSDRMSRIHLQDALERIDAILNPKG
jgi:hypothetical protein